MKYFITLSVILFLLLVWYLNVPKKNLNTNYSNNSATISQNSDYKSIEQEIYNQQKIKQNQININSINNINIENTDQKIIQEYENNIKSTNSTNQSSDNNIKISKTKFSSNINNIIKISWNNIEDIIEVKIWNYIYYPSIIEWLLYILVEQNTKLNWEYEVLLVFKDNSVQKLYTKLFFSYNSESLIVSDITPSKIKNDIDRNIILQWKWFSKVISIQLSNNIVLKDTYFNIINDNVLNIKIPKGLDKWIYGINIMNTDWIIRPDSKIEILN